MLRSWAPWIVLTLGALSVLCLFFGIVGIGVGIAIDPTAPKPPLPAVIGMLLLFAWVPCVVLAALIGVLWLYGVWSWLPAEERRAAGWTSTVSPQVAASLLLVPYFNYYWLFASHLGVCGALDRLRVYYPTTSPAPRGLAIAAGVCTFALAPLSSFVWFLYMRRVEAMAREMVGQARARTAGAAAHAF